MEAFAAQIAVTAGVLAVCFAGPLLAFGLLAWRKRRLHARRRSPIARGLLRGPGQTLREHLEDAERDVGWDVAMLMVIPLMALALGMGQQWVLGRAISVWVAAIYITVAVAFIGHMVRKLWKAYVRIDRLKAGLDAELAVGQELDQLMRQGAAVFHDVPGEGFNIDHVVIARQGVFSVETKGYSKRAEHPGRAGATVTFDGQTLAFPGWSTRKPLEQAERQAQWLTRWLGSATGMEVAVLPVVALPGWFVERSGRGDVRVLNGREVAGLLRSRGTRTLSEDEMQRAIHQVEQRCRTVKPRFLAQPEGN